MKRGNRKMTTQQAEEIVARMPKDMQTSLALGMYQFNGDDAVADTGTIFGKVDVEDSWEGTPLAANRNFSNMSEGFENAPSRTRINDGWLPLDNFEGDNDFDYIFRKRGRRLVGKWFKKKHKQFKKSKIGGALDKAWVKTRDGVGKAVKKVGEWIKKGVLFLPRQAYRGLVALNYRGQAAKLEAARTKPEYKKKWSGIKKKWKSLGGKQSSLESAIRKGRNKKPLFCGAKCKKKAADYVKKNPDKVKFSGADGSFQLDTSKLYKMIRETTKKTDNFTNFDGLDLDRERLYDDVNQYGEYDNVEPVSTATFVMVGLGSAIIAALASYLIAIPQNKAAKKAVELQEKRDKAEIKQMAKDSNTNEAAVKKNLELMEAKVKDELDPTNQILNNPNLSPAEKKSAIEQVNQALGRKETGKMKKMIMYGALGLIGLLVLVKAFKK